MTKINNEQEFEVAIERIEELLKLVNNDTPTTDKNYIELDFISNLVVDYDEEHMDPSYKN